jgi:hypothetical protein
MPLFAGERAAHGLGSARPPADTSNFMRKLSPLKGSFFVEKAPSPSQPASPVRAGGSPVSSSPLKELNSNRSAPPRPPPADPEKALEDSGADATQGVTGRASEPLKSRPRLMRSTSDSLLLQAEKENPGCLSPEAVLKLYDRVSASVYCELALLAKLEAWNIPREKICLGRELGRGAGGVVYLARWCGLQCAAKTLHCQSAVQKRYDAQRAAEAGVARRDMLNEVAVLSHLRHPNLVLFLGACVGGEEVFILSEFIEHGNLEQHVASHKGR